MNNEAIRENLQIKNINKKEMAHKITEFWHTIEFFTQPVFPKESRNNAYKIKHEEENLLYDRDNKPYNILTMYHNLDINSTIKEIIDKDDEKFIRNTEKGKECYICVGKLERREIVKKLDESMGINIEEIEKDYSKLACFGLKTDSSGFYIKESFNLSPLLWGTRMVQQYGRKAQKEITSARYKDDLKKYEDILQKEPILTNETLKNVFTEISNDYIIPLLKKEYPYEGVFIYSRYPDQKILERLDSKSEDLSDLTHGYFTKDILMIGESIANNIYGNNSRMQSAVIDYITAACVRENQEETAINSKIDIKHDKEEIKKWLMPEKLPLGKWPSKYVPAFMQQIAINIQIAKDTTLSPIFSVNGPPGTGKTTLLKEIISNNIVERASLLVEYDIPDKAFDECLFSDGKQMKNGYDKCYYRYFKFKDDKLSHYGMFVASCNNNAVENITKDLPNGEELCKSLNGDRENDSQQKIEGLMEIENLFSLKKTDNHEVYRVKRKIEKDKYITETKELPDIYFSWLAHRMLTGDEALEKDFSEWGMISAPLGKRSNINNFCYHVLNPLIDEFLISNEKRRERLSNFTKFSLEFKKQLELVRQQENELILYSRMEETFYKSISKKEAEKAKKQLIIANQRDVIQILKKNKYNNEVQLEKAEYELQVIIKQLSIIEQKCNELKEKIEECKETRDNLSDKIINMEDSLKIFDRLCMLFGKETERLRRIKEIKGEKDKVFESEAYTKEEIKSELENSRQWSERLKSYNNNISQIRSNLSDVSQNILKQEQVYSIHQRDKNDIENTINDLYANFNQQMAEIKEKIDVLDSEFWDKFYSENTEDSTKAQLINPWIHDEFNRSREKLFYLALQVHKEFILSSTACRDNFINLAMMWQSRNNTDDELVNYSKVDREKAFPELLNTLFLFTPVISSTFASIQTFLGDIKESEKIGTLIVDEAGQASPQMALGALYRSKKAIIVGDPKQIEPVVTDDADHIKQVFSEEVLKAYLSKTISVQGFADQINRYGSYIKDSDEMGKGTWVGCPLIVHRRCINPMFKISNQISYGNSMKMKSIPPKAEVCEKFLYHKSQWFNIEGREKDTKGKNHFVKEQGEKVCRMLEESFRLYSGAPDLFIISPFKSVIEGMVEMLENCHELKKYKAVLTDWCDDNCGTVHKFQGKEASEVIFLLGCDNNALGAVKWVKSNIVNVAVTRAKYRIYVVGDYSVWNKSKYVRILNEHL